MKRRTALIALGLATVAMFAFLGAIDPSREQAGNPSILDFELAWSEDEAESILGEWGEEGRDAARLSLWSDYAFMAIYGAFFALAGIATRDLAADRGRLRLARAGAIAVPAAIAAPIFDALENVWLLITLDGPGGDLPPLLAGLFASAKFLTLALAILYAIAGLVLLVRDRRAAAEPEAPAP